MNRSRRNVLIAAAGLAAGALTPRIRATTRFDKDQFVDAIRAANQESDARAAVEEVLGRTVAAPNRVLDGLGEPARAGINVLHKAPDLTILNVIWAPLMVLLPHNHNMWASIGIYTGREDNILWRRDGSTIKASGAAALGTSEVYSLPHDAIHSVVNPIERLTGAIHIYGGDFFAPGRSEWDAGTLEERPFDLADALRTFQEANDRFNMGLKVESPEA